jgi:hypothetical protein
LQNVYIPVIRIRPYSVTTFAIPHERPRRTEKQEETQQNLTRGVFNGTISDKARRRLKQISEGWLLSIQEAKKGNMAHKGKKKNYITFVTLTLSASQKHTDNQIKRELLNDFIITVQRKFGVQEYIWRAESQANGNIHFHLFLDKYIHWFFLRNCWNKIQEKLGYITEFQSIHNHTNPNSTDIERIRTLKGASNYITKYIAKESENRTIEGRLWGCSDKLRNILSYEQQFDGRFSSLLQSLQDEKSIKVITEKHYKVFIGDIKAILSRSHIGISCLLKNHYQQIYKDLYI